MYDRMGLVVTWIEPIPDVFEQLCTNIRDFPRQRAIRALITDRDDIQYELNVASNNGESSSILRPTGHLSQFPNIAFTTKQLVDGVTLPTLLSRESVRLTNRCALILDTQGSELMVLQGAAQVLRSFRYVKIEAPDYEAYSGCARIDDIIQFMTDWGFVEHGRYKGAMSENKGAMSEKANGTYYDIVFRRSVLPH
jgi:FkbM family methyltransferase